jgi:urease subunit alpha
LWHPRFFGVRPDLVIKGGFITWSVMGDPNASIPTPQPEIYRPMFGAYGKSVQHTSVAFVSRRAADERSFAKLGIGKRIVAVKNCRAIGKKDMKHNAALPKMEVDPESYEVRADGNLLTSAPANVLPLAQRYFLF